MSIDILRKNKFLPEVKVIAFDMDGILSNPEFRSWLETTGSLAKHYGLGEKSDSYIQKHKDFFGDYLKKSTAQN